MKIEKFKYSEFEGNPKQWELNECVLGDINLVVGKNATGKSRTLSVLRNLAALFSESNELVWGEGKFSIQFKSDHSLFDYALEYHNKSVFFEELKVDNDQVLIRDEAGIGSIKAEQVGRMIPFQTEPSRLAIVAKRDSIQHPFIDELYNWALGVTLLKFGRDMGQDSFAIRASAEKNLEPESKINVKDTEKIVAMFLKGDKQFPNKYKHSVLADMQSIGYDLEDIGVDTLEGVTFVISPQVMPVMPLGAPSGIFVKEREVVDRIFQPFMSQGMFRALSTIIQVNYGLYVGGPTCLLIDDIGEGLDFSRSSALVKLVIEKAKDSSFQLLMTTNDRFIMNAVPLEFWIILVRKGGQVSNLNYKNSGEMFDNFQDTGLNNFDLFSSNYYKSG